MSTIELISSRPRQLLLGDYIYCGVELEEEGRVVEKYIRSGVEHRMTIPKQDNVKHGNAEMVDEEGRRMASLTFSNGNLSGPCVLYNSKGIIQFKGNLENGEKSGQCFEYDNRGREVFDGVYNGDCRIPYVEEIRDKAGFFIERSRDDLKEIAYTQYNLASKQRNGVCFVLTSDGQVEKELLYASGKEIVKRKFEGTKMMEYNDEGNLVYKGDYCGDWKSGFNRHGHGDEYDGNSSDESISTILYSGEFVNNTRAVLFDEITTGVFRGYYEEKTFDNKIVSISQMKAGDLIKHGRSLEFSTDQESDIPVSEKYFENGRVVYERVHIKGTKMSEYDEGGNQLYKGKFKYMDGKFLRWGKGIEYEGKKVIKYDGKFANSFYHGKGVLYRNGHAYFMGNWKCGYPDGDGSLYDDNGMVKMEGIWHLGYLNGVDYESGGKREMCSYLMNSRWIDMKVRMKRIEVYNEIERKENEIVACPGLNLSFSPDIEEIVIKSNRMNRQGSNISNMILDLSEFKQLKRIEIGNECFKNVREFVLGGLEKLESVKIGEMCFSISHGLSIKEGVDGMCRIKNCPNLLQLMIGNDSFADFDRFELSNVNSLQSIQFGNGCFFYSNCILKGEK